MRLLYQDLWASYKLVSPSITIHDARPARCHQECALTLAPHSARVGATRLSRIIHYTQVLISRRNIRSEGLSLLDATHVRG